MHFYDFLPKPWSELLPNASESARDLVSRLVRYESGQRISALEVRSYVRTRVALVLTAHRLLPSLISLTARKNEHELRLALVSWLQLDSVGRPPGRAEGSLGQFGAGGEDRQSHFHHKWTCVLDDGISAASLVQSKLLDMIITLSVVAASLP